MKQQRLQQMEEYIKKNEFCRLEDISEKFAISMSTVRRDIDALYRSGIIEKLYGGVQYTSKQPNSTVPYPQRETRLVKEKEIIGKIAADFVVPDDTIFIDSGTTTLRLLKHVNNLPINIVTNNLHAVNECIDKENIRLFFSGGEYYSLASSFVGPQALEAIEKYNITTAFLAATGVSENYAFTNSSPFETSIKKKIIQRSSKCYILVDHSKWDVVSLSTFASFTDVTGVLTDKEPPVKYMNIFYQHGIKVVYP